MTVLEESKTSVSVEDIQAAQGPISGETIRTPLVLSAAVSDRAGCPVHLKLENLQRTGSFKVRGALNTVMSLAPETRAQYDLRQLGKSRPWIGLCGKAFWSPLSASFFPRAQTLLSGLCSKS